jgi:DNA-binding LacI/PurR family transcriptional regulator
MADRISMQQVAERAGVSKNTVSLALRGSRRVSEDTRQRVLVAVEQVGYRLNPALSKLMSEVSLHPKRRSYLIIAFLNYFSDSLASERHLPLRGFYHGALRQAKAMGYDVREFPRPQSAGAKLQRDREIWTSGIDGLVIFPFEEGHGDDDLSTLPIPKVSIGFSWLREDGSRVACDYFGNMVALYRKLEAAGCKRIGVLVGSDMNQRTALRLTGGYFAAAAQAGHHPPPGILSFLEIGEVQKFVLAKRCDAILVSESFDYGHWQQITASSPAGRVRIGSYCLTPLQREQGLAGVDENYEAVGEVAITLLAVKIQEPLPGIAASLSVRVPGIFSDGASMSG